MSLFHEILSGSTLPSSERSFYSTLESLHKRRNSHLQKIHWLASSIGLTIELDTDQKSFETILTKVQQHAVDADTGIVQAILDHLADLYKLYGYKGYDEVREHILQMMTTLREKVKRQ